MFSRGTLNKYLFLDRFKADMKVLPRTEHMEPKWPGFPQMGQGTSMAGQSRLECEAKPQ